jgi:methylmalonyl-CoA/ethylmalonyl-CoA epimerase
MPESKIKRFHHVSIAVENAEAVMDSWSSIMGIGPWTGIDMKGNDRKGRPWTGKEYWAKVGDVVIELIEPGQGRIVQSKFLDDVGPGLHHVAFEVDDVDATMAEYQEKGAELMLHSPGSWAYFRTGGPDGSVIEISQHQDESERDVVHQ